MSEVTDFQGRARAAGPPGPEAEAEALIRRVGDRVRKARELKGIPRRVLSERSGVSPRYLAQLEAGEGNTLDRAESRVAKAIKWLNRRGRTLAIRIHARIPKCPVPPLRSDAHPGS